MDHETRRSGSCPEALSRRTYSFGVSVGPGPWTIKGKSNGATSPSREIRAGTTAHRPVWWYAQFR